MSATTPSYHYVPPPVPAATASTPSYLRPWHPGNAKAHTLAESLQPLTAAHPINPSGVYWFGRDLQGLAPYVQAKTSVAYWQARIYYAPPQSAAGAALEVESAFIRSSQPQRFLDPFHPGRLEFTVNPTGKLAAKDRKLPHHPLKQGYYVILPGAQPAVVVFLNGEMVTLTSIEKAQFPLTKLETLAGKLVRYSSR